MALPIVNSSRYTTVIPSTGQEVSFRPYLVKEEKILMIAMESKNQKQIIDALKDVIKSCVYDNINVNTLTIFDVESLFLKLRSKSVGEIVDVKIKCTNKECEHPNDIEVNLDDISISTVEEDNKTIQLNEKIGVVLNYPSIDTIKKYSEKELSSIKGITLLIVDCLESIYDEDNVYDAKNETKETLNNFIDSLNSKQFGKLAAFFGNMPTLKHDIEFECSKCKHQNSVELKGIESFFS